MDAKRTRQGVFLALGAYLLWGIAPIYFKLLQQIPLEEILTHRIIWSFFFMLLLLTLTRHWPQVRHTCRSGKRLLLLAVTALIIGTNWTLYIWAINNHHMLEASLGYFINPLVNVLLGMLFLGERFRRLQWLATTLAVCGVLVQLWQYGSLPLIALGLALTFSLYSLLRKKLGVDAQTGMLFETLWLLPLALLYLLFFNDNSAPSPSSWHLNLLLVAAGIVTTVPLLLFTAATARLRLSTLGFFQYLGPTIMFGLAVLFYGETVGEDKLLTFAFIWGALLLFILDAVMAQRRLPR